MSERGPLAYRSSQHPHYEYVWNSARASFCILVLAFVLKLTPMNILMNVMMMIFFIFLFLFFWCDEWMVECILGRIDECYESTSSCD